MLDGMQTQCFSLKPNSVHAYQAAGRLARALLVVAKVVDL
jgi:hypothetical protein